MNKLFKSLLGRLCHLPSRRWLALLAVGIVVGATLLGMLLSTTLMNNRAYAQAAVYQRLIVHTAVNQNQAVASVSPGQVPTPATLTSLAPALSSYLSTLTPNVGVEVYDVTHQRAYAQNNTAQFLTASSIKVPIMLTLFALTESQGREPDSSETNLLTAMIENSDNDAASALFLEIGGATGIANYLQSIGMSGLTPDDDAWGYSLITPQAMVTLLTQLHDGTILTATDRATALSLMQNVEADQQWGVGDTAPGGATFAMKNGWVPGPDGLWSVNTSGIVTTNGETYIVSVYTQEQPSLADGQAIVQKVCGAVATALT